MYVGNWHVVVVAVIIVVVPLTVAAAVLLVAFSALRLRPCAAYTPNPPPNAFLLTKTHCCCKKNRFLATFCFFSYQERMAFATIFAAWVPFFNSSCFWSFPSPPLRIAKTTVKFYNLQRVWEPPAESWKKLLTSILFPCYLRYVACNATKHVDIYSMCCPPGKKLILTVFCENTLHTKHRIYWQIQVQVSAKTICQIR